MRRSWPRGSEEGMGDGVLKSSSNQMRQAGRLEGVSRELLLKV
jgi:hypothetical protein